MSMETNLKNLAIRIGNEIKSVKTLINNNATDLSALTTNSKTSLIVAINELQSEINSISNSGGSNINDSSTSSGSSWSSQKTSDMLNSLKESILGPNVSDALDTLKEIGDLLIENDGQIEAITTGLANRVRFDQSQGLTASQQLQARQNIGAVSSADIGDTTTDYVVIFNQAIS